MADALDAQINIEKDLTPDWAAFENDLATAAPSAPPADIIQVETPPPPPAPDPTPAEPAAPAPAAPAGPPSNPEPGPSEDPSDKPLTRARLDRLPPVSQLTATIMVRNPDLEPEQAAAMARRQLGMAEPPPAGAPTAQPKPGEGDDPPPPVAADLDTQLAEVERQLEEAAEEGGTGAIYDRQINELNRERSRLMAKIEARETVAAHAAGVRSELAAADYEQANDQSIAAAEAEFGEHLSQPDSPLAQAVTAEIAAMEAVHEAVQRGDHSALDDPDVAVRYAEYRHPRYAERLTRREADALGLKPKSQAAGAPAAAAPPVGQPANPAPGAPPAQQPQMAPVSGSNGVARVEVAPANPEDAWKTDLAATPDGDWAALEKALSGDDAGAPAARVRFVA